MYLHFTQAAETDSALCSNKSTEIVPNGSVTGIPWVALVGYVGPVMCRLPALACLACLAPVICVTIYCQPPVFLADFFVRRPECKDLLRQSVVVVCVLN